MKQLSVNHESLGLLSNQLHVVKKGIQCPISSTLHTLTSILSNISKRFRSVFLSIIEDL